MLQGGPPLEKKDGVYFKIFPRGSTVLQNLWKTGFHAKSVNNGLSKCELCIFNKLYARINFVLY